MASSADIVSSMRNLNLDPSPDPSGTEPETERAEDGITSSQPTSAPKPGRATSKPVDVSARPSGSQSTNPKTPTAQAKRSTAYTTRRASEKIIDQAKGERTYQFHAQTEPSAVPASNNDAKKHRHRGRRRFKSVSNSTIPSSLPPLASPTPPKDLAPTSPERITETVPQEIFRYVVQVSKSSKSPETIIGVYTDLLRANKCAEKHVQRWGVDRSEVADIQSIFGCKAIATRRTWQCGMSEIRFGGSWVKVLPKKYVASEEGHKGTYLALDRSGWLFVIGVFADKESAWEACKKYRDQLAYCSKLEEKKQWFDEYGMFHSEGRIGGTSHHWFIVEFPLNREIQQ